MYCQLLDILQEGYWRSVLPLAKSHGMGVRSQEESHCDICLGDESQTSIQKARKQEAKLRRLQRVRKTKKDEMKNDGVPVNRPNGSESPYTKVWVPLILKNVQLFHTKYSQLA